MLTTPVPVPPLAACLHTRQNNWPKLVTHGHSLAAAMQGLAAAHKHASKQPSHPLAHPAHSQPASSHQLAMQLLSLLHSKRDGCWHGRTKSSESGCDGHNKTTTCMLGLHPPQDSTGGWPPAAAVLLSMPAARSVPRSGRGCYNSAGGLLFSCSPRWCLVLRLHLLLLLPACLPS